MFFNTYPRGTFTELARFHAGKALFLDTPEPVSYTHLEHSPVCGDLWDEGKRYRTED